MTKAQSKNRLKYRILTIIVIQILIGCGLVVAQQPVRDFQIWSETTFVKPILKTKDKKGKDVARLSLIFFGTLRLGQNRLYPVDRRVGAGFDLRLNENFSITPTYLYGSGEPIRGIDVFEHRIRFDLTYARKWKKVAIKNRNRVEYRARHAKPDIVRFRNKFTFQIPVKKGGEEWFVPFVASEPYYDFSAKSWNSHEFSAGISKKLSDKISAEFFYVHRNNKAPVLKHINGVGANFKIVL